MDEIQEVQGIMGKVRILWYKEEVRDFSDKMASIVIISKKIPLKYFETKSVNQPTKQATNQQTKHPTT
jgi:hypothetical protein